ncbi:MAG: hypothetical protein FJ087_13030 [Deltaproteobacteria bacterium]|nr:hypothetical protein [Deltaproteobacteria bacterium]
MTAEAIHEALGDNPVWDRPQGLVELELMPDGDLRVAGPPGLAGPGGRVFRVAEGGGLLDLGVPGAGAGDDDLPEALRNDLAARIGRAVDQAERAPFPGNVPGDVRRAIASRRDPERGRDESWQDVFRRLVERAFSRDEYTWARPHRRFLACGLLVPGLRSDPRPSVVIALDTSASMSRSDLAQVCAEIRPVLARCGDAVLVVHDAAVQEVVRSTAGILRWLEEGWVRGGGGTDHRPVFDWIARAGLDPDLFVGLTDCQSRYPDAAPGYPVVWVTPLHTWGRVAPWGRRVWVESVSHHETAAAALRVAGDHGG